MLEPSQYKDTKLDSETRNQLFIKFVEQSLDFDDKRIKSAESKINGLRDDLKRLDLAMWDYKDLDERLEETEKSIKNLYGQIHHSPKPKSLLDKILGR